MQLCHYRSSGTGVLISFEEEERELPGQTLPTEPKSTDLPQQIQGLGEFVLNLGAVHVYSYIHSLFDKQVEVLAAIS